MAMGLAVLMLVACSQHAPTQFEWVEPPSINSVEDIPYIVDNVILSVRVDGTIIQLDIVTLERMGTVSYEVFDPYLQAENEYTGVLLSRLEEVLGTAADLHFMALDDYTSTMTFDEIQRWPIMLATQSNGEYIEIEYGGPIRLIFPYDDYPNIDRVRYLDNWIWSICHIDVQIRMEEPCLLGTSY